MADPAPTLSPPRAEEDTPPARTSRPMRAVHVVALAAVAGLLVLLGWRVMHAAGGAHFVSAVRAGEKPAAPGFDLPVIWPRAEMWPSALQPAISDERLSPIELRGYPVVINFWASWCNPCKAEAPRLAAAARLHRGRVAFLGINVQDFTSAARHFLRKYGANYVSVHEGGSATYSRYGLLGLPETYYMDARGRIIAHSVGEVSRRELEAGIAELSRKGA